MNIHSMIRRMQFPSLFLIFLFCFSVSGVSSDNSSQVLILNSYHQTYEWTNKITRAVISTVNAEYPDTEFQIEYMDTKKIQTEEYYDLLLNTYKLKYKSANFSLVLTSDDNAFQFMLKYGQSLFPGVPVVFCGVNSFNESMLLDHPGYTGVLEDIQIKETLDIALQLFPDTKYIYSVCDNFFSSRSNKERVKKLENLYTSNVKFIYSDVNSFTQVLSELEQLSNNGIVLYLGFVLDADGVQYNIQGALEEVSHVSANPVFSFWDFTLNHGSVGGLLTNGTSQGQKAGEIIIEILSGVNPKDIPVVTKSPNNYMFDKKMMDKFDLKDSDLPAGSIIINKPYSFYTENRKKILPVLGFFLLTGLIILFLLQNIYQRKKVQKDLSSRNSLIQSIINSPSEMNIWSVDTNYRYSFFNNTHKDGMKRVWGVDIEIGHCLFDYLEPNYRLSVEQRYQRALNGEDFLIVTKLERQDGSFVYYDNYSSPIYNEEKEIIGLTVFAIEITKRKMAEDGIKESLKEKEILLKEIHHRVKNNLQIISSMLNLQESKIIHLNDRALFLESINRIDSIALIHELLYNSEDLSSIDMQIYFSDLVSNINNTIGDIDKQVNVIFEIEKVVLNVNIAVPLGMISNELITNSFKHAFAGVENPEIIITMKMENKNSLYLKIKDNGIGIDPEYDKEKPGTLGFELVNALTQQISADYDVNNKSGGLEFLFRIPYSID